MTAPQGRMLLKKLPILFKSKRNGKKMWIGLKENVNIQVVYAVNRLKECMIVLFSNSFSECYLIKSHCSVLFKRGGNFEVVHFCP